MQKDTKDALAELLAAQADLTAKIKKELTAAKKAGDWQTFVDLTITNPDAYAFSFSFFDEVPDNLKYELATMAYAHRGDSVPAVRKAVRSLRKYPRPALPEELTQQEIVTVYRAGEEEPEKAKYRLSWTIEEEVALFFLDKWRGRHAQHLYRAKIRPKDIIAYTDERNEKEILQYRKVFDIEVLR